MEINNVTLKEFIVLNLLLDNAKNALLKSVTLNKIIDLVKESEEQYEISESTIRRALTKFIALGFIAEGMRIGGAKTYYITESGIQFIEKRTAEYED